MPKASNLVTRQNGHRRPIRKEDCPKGEPFIFDRLAVRSPAQVGAQEMPRKRKPKFRHLRFRLNTELVERLKSRALARDKGVPGMRCSVSTLVREALKEWFPRHPDTEFFADARPEDVAAGLASLS